MIRNIVLNGVPLHDLDVAPWGTVTLRAIGLRGLGAPNRASFPAQGHGNVDMTSRLDGPVISLEGECIDTSTRTAAEGLELIQGAAFRCLSRGGWLQWTEEGTDGPLTLRRTVRLGGDTSTTNEGADNRVTWQIGLVATDEFALEQPTIITRGPALQDQPFNYAHNPSFETSTTGWSAIGGGFISRTVTPIPLINFGVDTLYPGCAPPVASSAYAAQISASTAGDGASLANAGAMTGLAALTPATQAMAAAYVLVPSSSTVREVTLTAAATGGATESVTVAITLGMLDRWVRIGVLLAIGGTDCTISLTADPGASPDSFYADCVSLTTADNDLYIDGTAIGYNAAWYGTAHESITVPSVSGSKYCVFHLPSAGLGEQTFTASISTAATGHTGVLAQYGDGLALCASASAPSSGVVTTYDSRTRSWTGGVPPISTLVTGQPPPIPTGGIDADGVLCAPRLLVCGLPGSGADGGSSTVTVISQRAHI